MVLSAKPDAPLWWRRDGGEGGYDVSGVGWWWEWWLWWWCIVLVMSRMWCWLVGVAWWCGRWLSWGVVAGDDDDNSGWWRDGKAVCDNNVRDYEVRITGARATEDLITFENVDPNKVVRYHYVDCLTFLSKSEPVFLDCHIKGFRAME
uniref:Uncharacterized protein n=1 Tax=Tanacetum cinerariifolium TaxID=118510 RepID=A0A6L2NDW9_TANCI|nr:hypothetical protein [Tanacetum cinerariifolium]